MITNFLTDRTQQVRLGKSRSSNWAITPGTLHGCLLFIFPSTLMTAPQQNGLLKSWSVEGDAAVICLIWHGERCSYGTTLTIWCGQNNLNLNMLKSLEMTENTHSTASGLEKYRCLGSQVSRDPTPSEKAQQGVLVLLVQARRKEARLSRAADWVLLCNHPVCSQTHYDKQSGGQKKKWTVPSCPSLRTCVSPESGNNWEQHCTTTTALTQAAPASPYRAHQNSHRKEEFLPLTDGYISINNPATTQPPFMHKYILDILLDIFTQCSKLSVSSICKSSNHWAAEIEYRRGNTLIPSYSKKIFDRISVPFKLQSFTQLLFYRFTIFILFNECIE